MTEDNKPQLMKTMTFFKETTDDWFGNYTISPGETGKGFVRVAVMELFPNRNFRVSVFGNDDIGMIYDRDSEWRALDMFMTVALLETVSKQKLLDLGFEYF